MTPKPKPLPPLFNATKPYSASAWIAILICLVVNAGVAIMLSARGQGRLGYFMQFYGTLLSQSETTYESIKLFILFYILLLIQLIQA